MEMGVGYTVRRIETVSKISKNTVIEVCNYIGLNRVESYVWYNIKNIKDKSNTVGIWKVKQLKSI